MGPISNIGPKTSWAARDRPEQYLEEICRRNVVGTSPDGGCTAATAANMLRGSRAIPAASVRRSWRTGCAPLRNVLREDSGRDQPSCCAAVDPPIRSMTGFNLPPSICTRRLYGFSTDRNSSSRWPEQVRTCVTLNGSGIQLAVGPQPLRLRNHNFGLAQRIMVKRLATSPHYPLGITDSAYKNQLVVVSVQYGPFNTYIPIRSTTIGKSRVARDPIAMHISWRSNSDIVSVTSIGYPRMRASGESSTTKYRLLHASGSHPIPPLYDPKASMTFRVVRTNQYNSDLSTRQMVTTWKVRTRVVR
ncbi:carboxyl-terminal-processing peptidase 1, chloroplastic [Dorcoceras hygrometricum]|uniref:Carboxyl-terminal-processing peptidase 1, chloroplastic n=1 Tax=Dorcoceras hygrometricum TaxID=472368 RepID=A0A2Z7BZY2_9LAMI|nr:carboxyl-terminal-processing peptidase 1, chloroplastic [Dorcoceras hygrometricum]